MEIGFAAGSDLENLDDEGFVTNRNAARYIIIVVVCRVLSYTY